MDDRNDRDRFDRDRFDRDGYHRSRDYRERYGHDRSGEQRPAWRGEGRDYQSNERADESRSDYGNRDYRGHSQSRDDWSIGNTDRNRYGRETDRSRETSMRTSAGYTGDYRGGYGAASQTGDYFGVGDFGSGSHAWDRGNSGSRGYSAYGGGSGGQTVQRDNRQWGDRQMGGSYQPGEGYARDDNQRGFIERATDEVMSWWGDEDAARRREQDHAGKGPSDYTRSDERIREDANDRLTDDWRVDARSISVTVNDGEVTLNGSVPSRQEKHRAEECVERVSGVKHVQNNLRVTGGDRASTTGNTMGAGSSSPSPLGQTALPGSQSGVPATTGEPGYQSELQSRSDANRTGKTADGAQSGSTTSGSTTGGRA
ncbi:BON domain-containing protein [Novosphingobium cyanobacteriorum]|uniref:BON domain-containing protein n=1 Tax=Novosphingobium cyanobacteriorum TaxID=3024215 RepID=A0ABT6CGH8_9SPHN|nr:BON domain-containing protein [Novosphingobium cyanobacteriorum]MDF8332881.1 BON domain-containing protein [Novosphingobium cyanobacteriorum]